MKKVYFSILFLIACKYSSVCSGNLVDSRVNFVIAKSGLNLREKPNVKSNVLTKIQFGKRVTYINSNSYGTQSTLIISQFNKDTIQANGNWVKVKYNNLVGFVLDSYLFYSDFKDIRPSFYDANLNNDFILVEPGCGCSNGNFYDPNEWDFTAIIEVGGNKVVFEKTDINYIYTKEYVCDLYIYSTIHANSKVKYIIGKRKENTTSFSNATKYTSIVFENGQSNFQIDKFTNIEVEINKNNFQKINLVFESNNQLMSRASLPSHGVEFIGDIDNDGINDYIINFASENSFTSLFLSTQNKIITNKVKEVARFYHRYCC